MAVDRTLGEILAPRIAAVAHAGRTEQQALHRRIQTLAGQRLHHQLQPEDRFARIVDARAGFRGRDELLVGRILAPVRHAGGMAQHVARGDHVHPRMVGQVVHPPIAHQPRVQVDHALVRQLQHQVGEHRLAQRGVLEQRVVRHRRPGLRVRHAQVARPYHLAPLHDGHADGRHAQGLHQARQVGQEGVGRNPVRGVVAGGGRSQPGPAQRGQRHRRQAGQPAAALQGCRGGVWRHGRCARGSIRK